ncbi:unnamed protein product [Porites evermanni]|uniref:Uncharacterized protein n=1 Tax=Porites evermanni TaxID=104178 RepID=A0ABN8LT94_9CNID|nr:unnamed protein product [Porites evermanni]
MAAKEAFKDVNRSKNKSLPTILTEDDVPGASLKGRKPEQLKNDELKGWLRCGGGSVSGTGVQLLERVKDYISSGLHLKVTDPDRGIHCIRKKQFEGTGNERDDKPETSMIVETETDEAMISEETLNDDPDFQSNSNFTIPNPTQCHSDNLDLTDENFIAVCKEYMKIIKIPEDGIDTVEEKTRGQSSNSDWFQYRYGRLTASKFDEMSNRRVTTPPDRLVRDVFQYNCRPNIPYQCQVGLEMEPVIIGKYIQHQENNGREGITEQMDTKQSSLLKVLAKHTKNFCLEITESGLRLKQKHSYYKQVQGVWRSLESHGVILLCTLIS